MRPSRGSSLRLPTRTTPPLDLAERDQEGPSWIGWDVLERPHEEKDGGSSPSAPTGEGLEPEPDVGSIVSKLHAPLSGEVLNDPESPPAVGPNL